MVGTCPTIYQNLVLYKENMLVVHTMSTVIATPMEFFIEIRIAVGADINARLLSNLEYFFERCVVDSTVRQNGFDHVDVVVAGESREVQNVGYLGVEIELNILTDVVHVPDDVIPHGDISLIKEITGRMHPNVPAPIVSTLWKVGNLLNDVVHELVRRMYSHEPVNHTLVCRSLVKTLCLHSITGSCTVCTVQACVDSRKIKD